ncbi:hypothetical protein ACGFZQ_42215 [Streptomyces sp. NPDC048254]
MVVVSCSGRGGQGGEERVDLGVDGLRVLARGEVGRVLLRVTSE